MVYIRNGCSQGSGAGELDEVVKTYKLPVISVRM